MPDTSTSTASPRPALPFYWPKGVSRDLRVPRITLDDNLTASAQRYPDKAAIIYAGASTSYAQLLGQVEALAGFLQQRLQLAPGQRVLLQSQNCPQFVIACYAIFRAGGVVVPVSAMTTATELRYYADNSGARLAIVAQELLASAQPCVDEGLLDAVIVHAYSDALPTTPPPDALPEVVTAPRQPLPAGPYHGFAAALALQLAPGPRVAQADMLATIPYTSGTTGHPKGCMHSHHSVLASLTGSRLWRGFNDDLVFLSVAPMFHMLGTQYGMNMPIAVGGTVVMMPRWDALLAARLIERHQVTAWTAPPSMVIDLFSQAAAHGLDLSSLAMLAGGGAAMPEAVSQMLAERYGLHYSEGYGLTETAAFLHANPPGHTKRQCLGVPTQGVHSMVVDPETLQELPAGEVGELVSSGAQVMQGYWRNDEANREAFFERHGRRYFRTGDLASVDADGYYFMRDRLKRMINANGYKVWPAEVENMLYSHPAVLEACVIAVPDAKRGESVKALVVLRPGAQASADEIIGWSRAQMAAYKVPRAVDFLAALPKSATGKIQWRALQEAAQQAAAPSHSLHTEHP
ncbi:long-chain-fatty-acid--CoA ligase [Comamonas sp.]|uniref:long-chain-fatty-acid--CoA ligase n=1 Tax=Comamonas sp. TaxID=34028 RepID=UPI003D129F90